MPHFLHPLRSVIRNNLPKWFQNASNAKHSNSLGIRAPGHVPSPGPPILQLLKATCIQKQCCMRGAHACVSLVADDPLSRRRSCTILKERDAPSRASRYQLLNVGGCSHLRPPGRLPLPLSHAPRKRHSGASANSPRHLIC